MNKIHPMTKSMIDFQNNLSPPPYNAIIVAENNTMPTQYNTHVPHKHHKIINQNIFSKEYQNINPFHLGKEYEIEKEKEKEKEKEIDEIVDSFLKYGI